MPPHHPLPCIKQDQSFERHQLLYASTAQGPPTHIHLHSWVPPRTWRLRQDTNLQSPDYFEKLKSDVIAEEKAKEEAQLKKNTEQEEAGDDISKNKRRADDSLPEKEPSKKKTKDSKKKESFSNWWCFKIWRKGFIWRKESICI